jgi:hypothetical protein
MAMTASSAIVVLEKERGRKKSDDREIKSSNIQSRHPTNMHNMDKYTKFQAP